MTFDCQSAQRAAGLPETTFAQRLAARSPDEQALYRLLLGALAAGAFDELTLTAAASAAGLGPQRARAALARLAEADLVAMDGSDTVMGVFPLSAASTHHTVTLADGRQLPAMCAVDALGIPSMLGQAGTVGSTDPTSGRPVTVTVADGEVSAEPPGAVVLLARFGDGALASACCQVIDFYVNATAAEAALSTPGITGTVLSVADAHALGVTLFADLPAT